MSAAKRPPESIDAALARLYDVDLIDDPGDLDLYLALASRANGPILELAVGSGRIAVPLVIAGFEVTGVDLDPAMLARAEQRAQAAGPDVARRLRLIEGDARTIRLPDAGRYAMTFIALNSILIVGSRSDQLAVLRTMKAHLEPAGIGVVDVWLPDAEDLARYDGRVGLEYVRRDPDSGRLVSKLASARYDAAAYTVELTGIYDEGDPGEPAIRWIRQDDLRMIGASELRAMAESAGLSVEIVAGAYDLLPLGPGDDRAVLITGAGRRRPRSKGPAREAGQGLV